MNREGEGRYRGRRGKRCDMQKGTVEKAREVAEEGREG